MTSEKLYRLHYTAPAPQTGEGFEGYSLPIGNGYMGINVFGGVEHELLSLNENSMHNPPNFKVSLEYGPDGENGWIVTTGVNPYTLNTPSLTSHSGVGNGPFTALLFWDWYEFTGDVQLLRQFIYPILEEMSLFLSKTLGDYDGKLLVTNSASPENADCRRTVGTGYDQQMIWENYSATKKAAEILGYTPADHPVLKIIEDQIDRLDPVIIGASGQIKEYREENFYGEFGQPQHRHISHLVSLYPGVLIADGSKEIKDAASKTLDLRGPGSLGWAVTHRQLCRARLEEGEAAYKCADYLIKEKLLPNLWNDKLCFQVDGNFGYTAATAEMLLQSHSDIKLLPALPKAWKNGSFSGLCARCAFTVGAKWQDSLVTEFEIYSRSGGSCVLRYPNISDCKIISGSASFEKLSRDSIRVTVMPNQKISFEL